MTAPQPNHAAGELHAPGLALAHHWLVKMRGGERTLEQICALFPGAPIYTLVAEPRRLSPSLQRHPLIESPLRYLPLARSKYPLFMPFFPRAVRAMAVSRHTTCLLSSDASVIKGLPLPEGIPHICYCYSPPRYLWEMGEIYAEKTSGLGALGRGVFKAVLPYVRRFDLQASRRVDLFIGISKFVQSRIRAYYDRPSELIYPPVAVHEFTPGRPVDDFYLIVSELTAYKRIDLAVQAFNALGRKLVIIGGGPEEGALKRMARPNIEFLGRQSFPVLKDHFERCRAFIFPGLEDFGITAVEAQAAGRPVIAFRGGGLLETVREQATGLFFDRQEPDCLAAAVQEFERRGAAEWIGPCRANAERFSEERFRQELRSLLLQRYPALFRETS